MLTIYTMDLSLVRYVEGINAVGQPATQRNESDGQKQREEKCGEEKHKIMNAKVESRNDGRPAAVQSQTKGRIRQMRKEKDLESTMMNADGNDMKNCFLHCDRAAMEEKLRASGGEPPGRSFNVG